MSVKITVKTPSGEKIIFSEKGKLLSELLSENGFTVPAFCAGRGICGKCKVKLLSGGFDGQKADDDKKILSCKAFVSGDAEIFADFPMGDGLTLSDTSGYKIGKSGIAVDIGTTTVAAAFLGEDGSIRTKAVLNPQSAFGADVISRIAASKDGKLPAMTRLIRETVRGLCNELCGSLAEEMVISGNTIMLHIFCGIAPDSMGEAPFEPVFTDMKKYNGEALGLPAKTVTVLPSVSAFVGSDITAGIFAAGLYKESGNVLFADLGTNGELVLSSGGRLFCTSAAAGPALEGATIECGCGGIRGAVNRVYDDGEIRYETIDGAGPVGICGAGLVDLIAALLKKELIDESGYIEEDFRLCDNVYLTKKDIREYQLCKSAIFSAAECLCESAGISTSRLDRIIIAGGLGAYINPQNALYTGLLPQISSEKITAAGNTSLRGALMCIGTDAAEKMQKIAHSCTVVSLGGSKAFSEKFMNNMFFE